MDAGLDPDWMAILTYAPFNIAFEVHGTSGHSCLAAGAAETGQPVDFWVVALEMMAEMGGVTWDGTTQTVTFTEPPGADPGRHLL